MHICLKITLTSHSEVTSDIIIFTSYQNFSDVCSVEVPILQETDFNISLTEVFKSMMADDPLMCPLDDFASNKEPDSGKTNSHEMIPTTSGQAL